MDSDEDIPILLDHEAPPPDSDCRPHQVPLTIICGFLGAGKSTLLNRILKERHGYRIAVIMNEFGDTADIEAKTINISSPGSDPNSTSLSTSSEEFLELANGCLCCSIKDSGIAAIEKLMQKKGSFDHILLETTGLADPGPIASMFWMNEEFAMGLGKDICLDSVVCVVDAVFGEKQMEEDHTVDGIGESLRQIACADVILLNKIDLVSSSKVNATEELLHNLNPAAQVFRTIKGQIDLRHVMGIGAYNSPPSLRHQKYRRDGGHDRGEPDSEHSNHYELRGISSLQVGCPVLTPPGLEKLDTWIRTVLWERHLPDRSHKNDVEVLRCKGLFTMESGEQLVLQGVRNLYEITRVDSGVMGVPDEGKIVLIGKGLGEEVRRSLELVFK